MTPGNIPAQEIYDLLAQANFAPTGNTYGSGEYWANVDRGMNLAIPYPKNGFISRTVFDHLSAYIDRHGL